MNKKDFFSLLLFAGIFILLVSLAYHVSNKYEEKLMQKIEQRVIDKIKNQ